MVLNTLISDRDLACEIRTKVEFEFFIEFLCVIPLLYLHNIY